LFANSLIPRHPGICLASARRHLLLYAHTRHAHSVARGIDRVATPPAFGH
jgi:hypothetical protein